MKVLIIIDMQNDFVTGTLANPAAEKIVDKIADYARNFNGYVVETRDTHDQGYLKTQEGKRLPVEHCICFSEGWEIVKPLQNIATAMMVIDKPTFGYAEEIAMTLNDNLTDIDTIEFVGTVTEICVVSNVLGLKPYFPEARFIVHADMCAGLSEEGHKAALTTMKACQVDVVGE